MRLPSLRNGLLVAGSMVALAVGASPLLVVGADHLDAPALGGLTTGGVSTPGSLHSDHGDRDINDVYAFQGRNASRTVLAMTTNPAINLFGGSFGRTSATSSTSTRTATPSRTWPTSSASARSTAARQTTRSPATRAAMPGRCRPASRSAGARPAAPASRHDQGWSEGLRRRAQRSVLLRPDRLRRHGLRARHGSAGQQRRPTSSSGSTPTPSSSRSPTMRSAAATSVSGA